MTTPVTPLAPVFVGIDVAKLTLDMARSDTRELLHVPNDAQGLRTILKQLASITPARIVLEATGGLEQPLLDALLDAGLPVARVNPGNVRHFAQAMGVLGKTDAIDARILVDFAQKAEVRRNSHPWSPAAGNLSSPAPSRRTAWVPPPASLPARPCSWS